MSCTIFGVIWTTKSVLLSISDLCVNNLGPKNGIRCNALSPGGVYENQDKKFVTKLKKLIPMGRMANKNEYHSVIQFLCSDASSYLNGQNIVMDGGRSIW